MITTERIKAIISFFSIIIGGFCNIKIYLWFRVLGFRYILWKIENYINTPPYFIIMLKIKKISAMLGKRVFTDSGDLFGEIEEVTLAENKIDSWRIRVSKDMGRSLNGARGIIIHHQFVKAIGDVFVINSANLPLSDKDDVSEEETMDLSQGNQ